jgi:hypothetical protein
VDSVGEDVVKVEWMVLIEQVKIRMEEGGWKRWRTWRREEHVVL